MNHYQTLELKADAEPDEIRRAYRRLAAKLHPDLLPDQLKEAGTAAFVTVQLAYEELADPVRRTAYDRKLDAMARPAPPPPDVPEPAAERPGPSADPGAGGPADPGHAGAPKFMDRVSALTIAVLVAGTGTGYIIAGVQIANAESGWAKFFPVSWMIITFMLMILAMFEEAVLFSMFLTLGAFGILAALLGGITWTMLGVQILCTLVIVGAVKLLAMFIADHADAVRAHG